MEEEETLINQWNLWVNKIDFLFVSEICLGIPIPGHIKSV